MVMFFLGFFVGIVATIIFAVFYSVWADNRKQEKQNELIRRISEGFCYDEQIENYDKRYESW